MKSDKKEVGISHQFLENQEEIEMRFNEKEVRDCYKFLAHEKETEIRLIDPKKINPPKSIFVKCEDEFIKECLKYNEKYNIYAGINERVSNGTDKRDVISVKTIVLDIDAKRERGFEKEPATNQELANCENDVDEIIQNMISAGTKPPTKLFSGNGYQIWIGIPKIEINDKNRDEIESKIQRFQDLIKVRYENKGSIDKIGDLPRIIKVWGTWNIKGTPTIERPHRLSKIILNGVREDDNAVWSQINSLEEEKEIIKITQIEELEKDFLPFPLSYLLYKYEHKKPDGWMRIVETLASFLRGIGLNQDKTISHIIEWSRRQPYREKGEENELCRIIQRIFVNEINCPNFDKLVDKGEGYPFFGLREVFANVEMGDDWRKFKNPVKYYKIKKERSELGNLDKLRMDVRGWLLSRKKEEATELITKYILENNFLYATRDDIKSELWIYRDGIYTPNAKTYIKEICREILQESFNNYLCNEVITKIESETYINQNEFFNNENRYEIPVQNGILNIMTREISPFNPKKIFFNKLPVYYNPEARCDYIKKFFKDILKNQEDSLVLFELIGYCLLKDYPFEKAFMLIGNGRNGKGKTLLLIKKFLGIENCSGIPLSLLVSSSTSVCELQGRLVNLAGDLSNTDLKETGMFKALTGRDLIGAKRKYLRDLFFMNYAKMVFACNELPRVYDLSVGFWSRWVLLEFPYEFVKKELYDEFDEKDRQFKKIMDENIIDKISTPEELSGLLNESLDGLDRLMKQKDFSSTTGTKEVKNFWIRKSDSFTAFCMDMLTEDSEGFISKREIRGCFNRYCKKYKLKGTSDRNIKVVLEDLFGVSDTQKNIMGRYEWVWDGVKWK